MTTPIRIAAIAITLACQPALAQAVGPGLQDVPAAPRSAAAIESDLAAMDAGLTAAISTPGGRAATPLGAPPPEQAPRRTALISPDAEPAAPRGGYTQTLLALGGVVLLILGLSWMYKRAARATGGLTGSLGAGGRAPAGVLEVLARYPLASRHTLVVLRFDRRIMLCSMVGGTRSSASGMTVLCELSEPEDVASVLVKTRDEAGESIARSFERTLREAEHFNESVETVPPVRIPRPRTHPGVGSNEQGDFLRRSLEAMRGGGRS